MVSRSRHVLAAVALALLPGCTRDGTPTVVPPPVSPSVAVSESASPPASGSPSASPSAAALPAQRLSWRSCGSGFECATLKVPLDYRNPGGRRIDIAVIRLPASGVRARRIGSLVLNPGGPGGSGVEFARQAKDLLPREIRARFDVVSFDPRGVAGSTPIDCMDGPGLDRVLGADPSPDSPAEHDRLVAVNREFTQACVQRSRDLLPHISSANVARDMDVLRAALGDAKLTYLGFSYGTVLGAWYAHLFPERVRALVLDGAVDLSLTMEQLTRDQARGFEQALDTFLDHCRSARSCAFRRAGDLRRAYDELVARIDREPLPAKRYPGRRLGPGEALFGIAAGLYSPEFGWPALGEGLAQAYDGDGSGLLLLFDTLVERRLDGSYSNSVEALIAVNCVDAKYPTDIAAYDRLAASMARESRRFGRAFAYGSLPCAFWPVTTPDFGDQVTGAGAPPIVVIGTTGDPATPFTWAEALAGQLRSAVLVTYEGEGHTAYGYSRNDCIDGLVNAYLINLTVPAAGTRCR